MKFSTIVMSISAVIMIIMSSCTPSGELSSVGCDLGSI